MANWKRATEITLAVALFAGVATVGFAQQNAADTIAARTAAMKGVGGSAAAIANAMKADTPDFAAANVAAKKIAATFATFPAMFPAGTGPDSGVMTKAKAEIWTNMDGFKAANAKSVAAANALVDATSGTDAAAVGTAMTALRGTCGGCHSQFRT